MKEKIIAAVNAITVTFVCLFIGYIIGYFIWGLFIMITEIIETYHYIVYGIVAVSVIWIYVMILRQD